LAGRVVAALGALAMLCGIALFPSAVPAGATPILDCGAAPVNLVANCGFEAGSGSDYQPPSWQTANAYVNGQAHSGVQDGPGDPHSGRYFYAFDNNYPFSELSQTIAVRPNWNYTLSFWLANTVYTHFAALAQIPA